MTQIVRRRLLHSSVIAGDWIYIDGGEIVYEVNTSVPTNTTFAIDLSKSWTNSSLNLITTIRPSDSLALNQQSLWWSKTKNIIYCFGGGKSAANLTGGGIPTPPESIWGFSPDGRGSGTWNELLGPTALPFPPNIIRSVAAASACDDQNQKGYSLGGLVSAFTSPEVSSVYGLAGFPILGMLSFDFENLSLVNSSGSDYYASIANHQNSQPSFMLQVPLYGADGILLLIGAYPGGFNNISMYDTRSGNWDYQIPSGDIPDPRDLFCAVGIQDNSNSSYEIFVFGGVLNGRYGQASINSDQVYILSLPAFHWVRANNTFTSPRAGHTCHATTTGQMILIGGLDPTQASFGWFNSAINGTIDPWNQTIGVFDMSSLQWKDFYDANAGLYTPPDVIKKYYSLDTNRYPSTWTSPGVQALFQPVIISTPTPSSSVVPIPTPSSSIVPTPTPTSSHHTQLSSGTKGAIIAGSILAVALILTAIILARCRRCLRTRIKAAPPPDFAIGSPELQELAATSRILELKDNRISGAELCAVEHPIEAPASMRYAQELPVIQL